MNSARETGENPRVLISLWPGLGDIMFATPAIRHIRHAVPGAYIAAACLAGGPGSALLETNPYIDEVYFSVNGPYSPAGMLESLSWARPRGFDVGIELSYSVQWFFILSGIKNRYRFGERNLWWLYPYRRKDGIELHSAEHFSRTCEKAFGSLGRDGAGYDLFLTDEDEHRAESLLERGGVDGFVSFHPGARCNENKRWALAKFIELGRRLMAETGKEIVVIGGEEDRPLGEVIKRELRNGVTVLAGTTSLRETAAVVKRADLYVGNDSGPLQVAASTGTPVVGIFASTNPDSFGPLGQRATVVQPEDDCVPCLHFPGYNWLPWGLRLRYYDRCRAMEGLGVQPVFKACMDMLEGG